MILLVGQGRRAVQEQELRAIQTDAVGAVAQRRLHLPRQLDIRPEHDGHAIGGHGWKIPRLQVFPLLVAVGGAHLQRHLLLAPVRIDQDGPLHAVHDEQVPGLHRAADPVQADHRGNLQGVGHDGGVGRPAAHLRDEADDPLGV